ncbi:hypothetical protein ACP4OV_017059 [Aristida adscensionis]
MSKSMSKSALKSEAPVVSATPIDPGTDSMLPHHRSGRRRRRRRQVPAESSLDSCPEEELVPSAQRLQEASSITAVSSSSSSHAEGTSDILEPSSPCLPSPPGPGSCIWSRLVRDWGLTVYIRVDQRGSFHTYPDVGGDPFQSLEEADRAIDRYLDTRRDPKMCMEQDGLSQKEKMIRRSLYWPHGTIKKFTKSRETERFHSEMRRMGQALVDKYNDDNNLLEDLAYEIKGILYRQLLCENFSWYTHLNFTTKAKGASDVDCGTESILFAEVRCMTQGKHVNWLSVVSAWLILLLMGQHCYGCARNGCVEMKHPDSSVEFTAGHLDVVLPFGGGPREWNWSDSEDDETYLKTREAKIRRTLEGRGDSHVELFSLPSGVASVRD